MRSRCLFCGVHASDVPLLKQLDRLACTDCFDGIGRIFARLDPRRRTAMAERCLACGRDARKRVLVAGVAAAICRRCYRKANRRLPIPSSARELGRKQSKALDRSRAIRLRARRRVLQIDRIGHSIKPGSLKPGPGAMRTRRLLALALKRLDAAGKMRPRLFGVEEKAQPRSSDRTTNRQRVRASSRGSRGGRR
jgi:hypothetical protein